MTCIEYAPCTLPFTIALLTSFFLKTYFRPTASPKEMLKVAHIGVAAWGIWIRYVEVEDN